MAGEHTRGDSGAAATQTRVRAALVDDHPYLREGVATVLDRAGDIELVTAVDSVDALADHTGAQPDVVVLDLYLPRGPSGIRAVARVRELGYRVLVLTAESDPSRLLAAVEAGALGVLRKSGDVAALRAAVRAVAAGESLITATVASRMESRARSSAKLAFPPALADVLRLLALGLDNRAIACRRHVTVSTVKKQVREIRDTFSAAGIEIGDRANLRDVAREKAADDWIC